MAAAPPAPPPLRRSSCSATARWGCRGRAQCPGALLPRLNARQLTGHRSWLRGCEATCSASFPSWTAAEPAALPAQGPAFSEGAAPAAHRPAAGVLPRPRGCGAALLRGAGFPLPASPRRRRLFAGSHHALGPARECVGPPSLAVPRPPSPLAVPGHSGVTTNASIARARGRQPPAASLHLWRTQHQAPPRCSPLACVHCHTAPRRAPPLLQKYWDPRGGKPWHFLSAAMIEAAFKRSPQWGALQSVLDSPFDRAAADPLALATHK